MIDDLLQTCEKIDADKTLTIERSQVILWIRAYRLIVLRQDVNSNSVIDPTYVTRFGIELELQEGPPDNGLSFVWMYRSITPLPALPVLTGRFAILSVIIPFSSSDPIWPLNNPDTVVVPLTDEASSLYLPHSRYEPFSVAGYVDNKYLCI